MSDPVIGLVIFGGLIICLASGIWVALALTGVGVATLALFTNAPVGLVLASTFWGHSHSWSLAALPLFILTGEILLRSRLSEDMFTGLAPWLGRLPGGLLHVNVLGCAMFAAVSGSSAATAATIGKISIPQLQARQYPENLIVGTLAGSATLGLLIPPSIILIVYGVATEQSISRLFIAGLLPGLILVVLFSGYVAICSLISPSTMPRIHERTGLCEKLRRSRNLIPLGLLIGGVVGSIYTGLASPTDAAALSVLFSIVLAFRAGDFTVKYFLEALLSATRTSCMITFILVGAALLSVSMGFIGLPRHLASWIDSMQLSSAGLLFALTLFFVVLGLFLDGISVVVLTTSVIMPMVEAANIDPVWFGIYLVIVVEMSQITPPVGFNLFVIQAMTGIDIVRVAKAAFPFFMILLLSVILISVFPSLATMGSNTVFG